MPLSQENTLHIWPCGNCALTNYHILTNAIKQNVAKNNTQQQNVQKMTNHLPPGSQYVLCLLKKYATAAQLIRLTMKNKRFILNENHSYKQVSKQTITIRCVTPTNNTIINT